MPTPKGINENSLKLTGNKINLTVRPIETRSTASSRCALIGKGYSRPLSAVPLLNLHYNEFEMHAETTRRPYSADFPISRIKNSNHGSNMTHNMYGSIFVDGETSLESGDDEIERNLPSSELLHNLLSEPLFSWRNGVRCKPSRKVKISKKSIVKPNNKAYTNGSSSGESTSAGSDTSSSAESLRLYPSPSTPEIKSQRLTTTDWKEESKLQRFLNVKNDDVIIKDVYEVTRTDNIAPVTARNSITNDHKVLKPRQSELLVPTITINETSSDQKSSLLKPEYLETTDAMSSNSNPMTLVPGLKTKPPLPKKPDLNQGKTSKKIDNATTLIDDSNFESIMLGMLNYGSIEHQQDLPATQSDEPTPDNNQTSTSTLASDNDAVELRFQNWIEEEQKANEEVICSEINTNISLHKLKLQNQQNSEPKVSTKAVNFESLDMQQLKRDYDKHRKNASSKNFIKQNIKLSASRKKISAIVNNVECPKKKFVPTQMRSFTDYSESHENRDVESWMSSSDEPLSNSPDIKHDSSLKPSSYLDFLNKIDELQETCGNTCMEDVPEHDQNNEEETDETDANTYDDIVSILQVLEAEDKKSQRKIECIKELVSTELSTSEGEESRRTSHRSPCLDEQQVQRNVSSLKVCGDDVTNNWNSPKRFRDQDQPSRISLNSSMNLNDIFSYLDEVDKNCAQSLACAKERIQCTTQVMETNITLDTIPKLEQLLAYTNVELAHLIVDLHLRLKEKSSSIALLQKELSTLRNQVTKMTKDTNEIVKERLRTQKEDYENVVKRHQKFIDQLIADKKTLNQQCEGLIHEMKVLEDRYSSNLKAAEHKHKIELQKIKEMHMAGEKIRRERWIDTKTQKIKELTVKGLEPELDKMAARHQQEISDLRSLHKREIEDLDLRAARKMQQQCESLREQLTTEREKALVHEREVLRQRYEQLVESEEKNYQEQRRRLLAEHASRISECEERETSATLERDRGIKQAQNEFEDKLQAVMRRHNTELNVLKEKTELEMEAFRNNYKKHAAVQLTEKEVQIREKCRKERDKEIEAVIERLEAESSENKVQMEQSTENRIRRLKEKYEKEIKDLENTEKEATTKYSEVKTKLLESEDVTINLKASVKHLEMQLQETKEVSEKLSKERNKIKEVVKEEMKLEIQTLEKEVRSLKNDKDKELQQVYARVKVAVARRDETISELSRDHAALQEKCTYLENMLEQQRKEYLIK